MTRYRHHRLEVDSKLLRGNPLGDPHRRTLHVVAPEQETGPLPVVWILTGYAGSAEDLFTSDPWSEGLLQRVERLSATGVLPPAIFVAPDCFTALGGSQYLNSSATGPYADHIWQELKPLVESRFPCGRHGMAGRSSGGFGALVHGMRHPEHVSAVACHAGDMCFEYCYLGDLPALASALESHGSIEAMLDAFARDPKKREGRWIHPLNILCMAACYSPDPTQPSGIALPFEPGTGAIRQDVWERWLAFDPLRMIEGDEAAANLRKLDLLFLDCGNRDEFNLQWGLRQFVEKLEAKGIGHEHEEFDDGHRGTSYRYDVSLPKLVRALTS